MVLFALSLVLHTLASIVWVGGVFFVRVVLIPSLHGWEAPERFAVLARVMPVFFRVIWGAVVVLLLTGYGVLLFGYSDGLGGGGVHVDIMQFFGWILILSFVYMDLGPFRGFLRARAGGDMDRAAHKLDELRKGMSYTLFLGMVTAAVGATGSLWAY
jgi:uncharacterized membrane protein